MKKSIGAQSLLYPNPVLVIGTYDAEGRPNIMAVAWGGICCSQPPAISIALRKATYSYHNIIEQKAFTVNIPSETFVAQADHTGIYSGRTENKFDTLGLTPVAADTVHAPLIAEFPYSMECALIHSYEIGLHTIFIGEIKDIKVDVEMLGSNGVPSIENMKPFVYDHGSRKYFRVGTVLADAFSVGKK